MARLVTECSVAECEKLSGVPGTARGLCTLHYQRRQRYGDAEVAPPVHEKATCSIAGCGKPVAGRGLCGAHWYHWRKYGDPARRMVGQVADGKRVCSRCREDKPLEEFGRCKATATGYATYCKPCAYGKKLEWRAAHPDYVEPPKPPGYHSSYRMARAARKRRAFVEHVSPRVVFERDGWACGICHEPIDATLTHPNPMSASVDHVIPLVRHGKHSYSNVQAAHLVCNLRKGARVLVGSDV